MISSNQQILIVIVIGIVIIFLLSNRSEDFATTSESIANLASMYNASKLTANDIKATNLNVANIQVTDILDAKTMYTTGINSGKNTPEGGRIDIINYSKKGDDIGTWTIYNMTGGYDKGLNFWRYNEAGKHVGPSVIFKDSGDVIMKNNLDICGNLYINGGVVPPIYYFKYTGNEWETKQNSTFFNSIARTKFNKNEVNGTMKKFIFHFTGNPDLAYSSRSHTVTYIKDGNYIDGFDEGMYRQVLKVDIA
jgi:hypothetical protein